jgi:hypothetical protein
VRLDQLLDATTRARVPALVWGPPGVGKTAAIRAWAARRKLHCWTVVASLREPSDFAGLPIVDAVSDATTAGDDTRMPSVRFAPPRFAVEAARHGGVIFLDELTTAPPAVQAALLRAVVDAAFGDLQLDPERVTLVAAANPPDEAAGGWDLAAPLANRFVHHTYNLLVQEWTEAFPGYWGSPPRLVFGGRALDRAKWTTARATLAAFIRVRPNLLLQLPRDGTTRGQAWPSPRTWDYCSRLLASVEQSGGSALEALNLLAGSIGEGAALELRTWLAELDLPDPEDLLADPAAYRHPERGDQAFAILSSVAQAAIQELTPERWHAAWKVLARAAEVGGADVAAAAARDLARARTADLDAPVSELRYFFPILEAVGLLLPTPRPAAARC